MHGKKMVHESSRGPFRAEEVHAWTASSAAERRWCRLGVYFVVVVPALDPGDRHCVGLPHLVMSLQSALLLGRLQPVAPSLVFGVDLHASAPCALCRRLAPSSVDDDFSAEAAVT